MRQTMITKNVRILSQIDLEKIAFRVISDYDSTLLQKPQALNVDDFAEKYLKIKLDYADLSHNGSILGMMVFSDSSVPAYDPDHDELFSLDAKAKTALIDRSLLDEKKASRCRFTILHECSHWLIHKPLNVEKSIICRASGPKIERDWREWQADNLSSALLMPAAAIYAFMRDYASKNRKKLEFMYGMYGDRYARTKRSQIIRLVGYTFQVSEQAAEVRLAKLGYLKIRENTA